jgi:hypothetical protein
MANELLNISMITKEALRELKNQLGFSKGVNRQYDDQFAKSGAKIGSTLNIRKPVRYTVADQQVPLVVDQQKHVAFQFSSKELTLNIDEFSSRYLKTAVTALANKIDFDGLAQYKDVWSAVGTPGTTPSTLATALEAGVKLDHNGCPVDDQRSICLNPAAQAGYVDGLKGLFQSSEQIKKQYEKGLMGLAAGFKWKMDQNVNVHTTGAYVGDPEVNGTTLEGADEIVTDGWTGSVTGLLKKGDVFTIAGVFAVNPQNRQSTGQLMQFVVTADVNSVTGGATIPISPAVRAAGQYQNVTALPVDNAEITVLGAASTATPVNLAYHKDAFVLGMADLELPGGTDMAARAVDPDAGLSIRIVRAYDINTDRFPCRLDVLYGWKAVYPELACRIHG